MRLENVHPISAVRNRGSSGLDLLGIEQNEQPSQEDAPWQQRTQ
jgi:hypothetical protein